MVAKVMACTDSVKNPLYYNLQKALMGEARVIAVNRIPSKKYDDIYRTLMYQESMAIKTKKPSIHIALSADRFAGELLSDEQIEELTKKILSDSGLGEQPYVVYKHEDTDVVHYHIVSTKIQDNGKSVRWNGIGKTLTNNLAKYGKEYGYVAGAELHHSKKYLGTGITHKIKTRINEIIAENTCHSWEQFTEKANEQNLEVRKKKSKHVDKNILTVNRLDAEGERVGRPIYFSPLETEQIEKSINQKPGVEHVQELSITPQQQLLKQMRFKAIEARNMSRTMDEFRQRLRKRGIQLEEPGQTGSQKDHDLHYSLIDKPAITERGYSLDRTALSYGEVRATLSRNLARDIQKNYEQIKSTVLGLFAVISKTIAFIKKKEYKDYLCFETRDKNEELNKDFVNDLLNGFIKNKIPNQTSNQIIEITGGMMKCLNRFANQVVQVVNSATKDIQALDNNNFKAKTILTKGIRGLKTEIDNLYEEKKRIEIKDESILHDFLLVENSLDEFLNGMKTIDEEIKRIEKQKQVSEKNEAIKTDLGKEKSMEKEVCEKVKTSTDNVISVVSDNNPDIVRQKILEEQRTKGYSTELQNKLEIHKKRVAQLEDRKIEIIKGEPYQTRYNIDTGKKEYRRFNSFSMRNVEWSTTIEQADERYREIADRQINRLIGVSPQVERNQEQSHAQNASDDWDLSL